jgi:hypothetical protein
MPSGPALAVVVGYGTRRARSTDGVTWTNFVQVDPDGGDDDNLLRGVGFGNGRFIAVGGAAIGISMTSVDGITWTNEVRTHNAWLGNVVWLGGAFIAAGGNGLRTRSLDNGATWSAGVGYQPIHYRDVATNGTIAVAAGHTYNTTPPLGIIATTTDGVTWTERRRAGVSLNRIVSGNGVFVAAGPGNSVVRSADGITWTDVAIGGSGDIELVFANGAFVASVGGTLFRSTDGQQWQPISGSRAPIAYIAGRYINLGWPARIEVSTNLTTWTSAFAPQGSGFTKVAVGTAP